MKKPVIAAIVVVLIAVAGWFAYSHRADNANTGSAPAAPKPVAIAQTPGVEIQYVNTALKFSFTVPDGVLAQEFPGRTGIVVRLHDAAGANHLAVFTAAGKNDPSAFTADQVQKDDPGTSVNDASAQTMLGNITALEFTSDSKAWGGPSRELWFAYKGVRYEVSVPLADAKLLDFVRDHWQWRK